MGSLFHLLKMRILVLNYEFPPVGGGGGRVSQEISRALAQNGHEVRVQTSLADGLPREEARDGYRIWRVFSFRRRRESCTVFEMACYVLTNLIPLFKQVRSWKPHVIHAHFAVPTGILAWLVGTVTRTPYVITAHLGDVPGAIPEQTDRLFFWIKPLTVPIWRSAAKVTAVSSHVADLAAQAYKVSVTTIFNGLKMPDDWPQAAPQLLQVKRLLFIGRFNAQKNLLFLIDLLAAIRDLNWQMDLIGDGPLKVDVFQKIQAAGLQQRVICHGWQEPQAIKPYLQAADILLMPSLSEGLSVVAVEALAYSTAILASDIPGMRDVVVDGENGYLCRLNDRAHFEDRLRSLLADETLLDSMKKTSLKHAALFDLQKIVATYERILSEAAKCRIRS